jgi:hypothetical protein
MQCKVFATLFAILGLMHWPDDALAATLAGTVIAVSGSCTADGRVLRLNDPVEVSDAVIVPDGGKLRLRMTDASTIAIASGSSMSVTSYSISDSARNAKVSLTRGLLRAVVAPVGGSSTFEVSTPVGTASVRSADADWLVEAQPGWAQVGVEAGTVDLTSAATGRSVTIRSRWGGRAEAGRDPVPPRLWGQVEYDQRKVRTE